MRASYKAQIYVPMEIRAPSAGAFAFVAEDTPCAVCFKPLRIGGARCIHCLRDAHYICQKGDICVNCLEGDA